MLGLIVGRGRVPQLCITLPDKFEFWRSIKAPLAESLAIGAALGGVIGGSEVCGEFQSGERVAGLGGVRASYNCIDAVNQLVSVW